MKMRLNWRALRCQHQLFKDYYQSLVPLLSMPVSEAPLMAMDLEMTGLDPLQDQILSIGLVPIEHGVIPLEGAQQKLVQIRGSVGQSATIHGILDNHLVQAVTIEDAMDGLLLKHVQSVGCASFPIRLPIFTAGYFGYLSSSGIFTLDRYLNA